MHIVIFFLVALTWSASFILMKRASDVFGPISIAALRVLGGGLVLGVYLLYRRQLTFPRRSQLLFLSVVIIIGYVIPYGLQPYLITIFGSAFIGMIVSFVPLMTIIVSIPILRIFPNRGQIVGVVIGLICVLMVIADGFQRIGNGAWYLLLLPLLVPAGYATANTLVRRHFQEVAPVLLSTWCFAAATLLLLPLGYATESINYSGDMTTAIIAVAILGIIGTGFTMALFYYLIQQRGPLYAGMVAYVIPIGALIIGALDGEEISIIQVCAIIGVIGMVVLVQRNSTVKSLDADT